MRHPIPILLAALLTALSAVCPAQTPAGTTTPPSAESNWFARIDGVEIAAADYDQVARETFRNKFYHGSPPEAEINAMLREVGDLMIDRTLLKREIDALNIAADEKSVAADLASLERRFAGNPAWIAQREQALPGLRAQAELKSRFTLHEKAIRNVAASDSEVRHFYDKNPELFTEPVKNHVSLILLRVNPSAGSAVWEETRKSGDEIRAMLDAGANFADIARKRSMDISAEKGGDLGYLHQGMLAPSVETELAAMKPGSLGGPTQTLEGYVVFRLDDRTPAKLRDFPEVEKRARELFLRQKANETWANHLAALRKAARIEIGPAFQKIMTRSNAITQPDASPIKTN